MLHRTIKGGLLLPVLALLLLAGGCRHTEPNELSLNAERLAESRRQIVKTVPDADRRQQMLDIIDAFEVEAQRILSDIKAVREQIVEANRSYDTTRTDLERLYAMQEEGFEQLLDLTKSDSLKLRTLCSREEWSIIFAHEEQAIEFTF